MLLHTIDYSILYIKLSYAWGNQKNLCDLLYWGALEPNPQRLPGTSVVLKGVNSTRKFFVL